MTRNADAILTVLGGACLLIGLVAALLSNRYASMKGLLLARDPLRSGSLAESPKARADRWFSVGLVLTAVGIVLQTTAAVRSLLLPR